MASKSNRIIVTVIGVDTVGIIAKVSAVLADANANTGRNFKRSTRPTGPPASSGTLRPAALAEKNTSSPTRNA